jgi:hypothetical protein
MSHASLVEPNTIYKIKKETYVIAKFISHLRSATYFKNHLVTHKFFQK